MTTETRDLYVTAKPILTGGMAKYPYSKKLIKQFTGTSRFGDEYKIYRMTADSKHILLPRAVCPIGEKDLRVTGHKIKFNSKIELRKKQIPIVSKSVRYLKNDQSHIINAYTGFGKTVCGCEIISRMGLPTLIIVPKEDLMEAWHEEVKEKLGLKDSEIGIIQQDRCEYKGKKVVIAMLHSICIEGRYPAAIRKAFGFIIFDEVHRLAAEEFSKACGMFSAKYRLGLSATTERADGKEAVFEAHIGPVLVKSKAKPMKFKVLRYFTDWKCPRRREAGPKGTVITTRIKHSAARIGAVLPSLCNDKFTNKIMTNLLVKSYNKGRFIIFFSDRREHLEDMMDMAVSAGIKRKQMSLYVGGMKKHERDTAKTRRVLFATYGMMKEGTNIPWFDTIIFGTPRSDVVQAVGRILREYPDKPQPIVFDRIDKDSPVFLGYSRKRGQYYDSMNAEVKDLESL